jgi:molecular chaperone HscA
MNFHVVQGEREVVSDCRSLARFKLSGLPRLAAGSARVKVTFSVDADGLLHVSAEETSTGTRASVQVKPSYGLDDATIEKMILDSIEHADEDVNERLLLESRVEAERILIAMRGALEEDQELLAADERSALEEGMKSLQESAAGTNHRLIQSRTEKLNELSVEFAARRMDRAIRSALVGRRTPHIT